MKMVEMSDVSETLVKSLALLDRNLHIKLKVMKVLQKLSCNSGSFSGLEVMCLSNFHHHRCSDCGKLE